MSILKVLLNGVPSFKAKTQINAPETMLSGKDKAYFEELGKKYRAPQDILEITISNLYHNEKSPEVECYNVTKAIKTSSSTMQSTKAIPYRKGGVTIEKNSPKNYLIKTFNEMLSK